MASLIHNHLSEKKSNRHLKRLKTVWPYYNNFPVPFLPLQLRFTIHTVPPLLQLKEQQKYRRGREPRIDHIQST
ncbi:hypothetical protein LguiA_024476 [Lonicera macranthoides]